MKVKRVENRGYIWYTNFHDQEISLDDIIVGALLGSLITFGVIAIFRMWIL